jgi:hypothetical protein
MTPARGTRVSLPCAGKLTALSESPGEITYRSSLDESFSTECQRWRVRMQTPEDEDYPLGKGRGLNRAARSSSLEASDAQHVRRRAVR